MTWAELRADLWQPDVILNPFAWFLFLIWLFLLACFLAPIVAFACGIAGLICEAYRERKRK